MYSKALVHAFEDSSLSNTLREWSWERQLCNQPKIKCNKLQNQTTCYTDLSMLKKSICIISAYKTKLVVKRYSENLVQKTV